MEIKEQNKKQIEKDIYLVIIASMARVTFELLSDKSKI